jgi:hypothetical protein
MPWFFSLQLCHCRQVLAVTFNGQVTVAARSEQSVQESRFALEIDGPVQPASLWRLSRLLSETQADGQFDFVCRSIPPTANFNIAHLPRGSPVALENTTPLQLHCYTATGLGAPRSLSKASHNSLLGGFVFATRAN